MIIYGIDNEDHQASLSKDSAGLSQAAFQTLMGIASNKKPMSLAQLRS